MFTLVDTEAGNFHSVAGALRYVGATINITKHIDDIQKASAIILPGVAAFASGIGSLRKNNLVEVIKHKALVEKTPILGICLGMQLLGKSSAENGEHQGLGLLDAKVVKLEPTSKAYRVPNIGWSNVVPTRQGVMFEAQAQGLSFYHVHSYHMQCADQNDVAAVIEYDGREVAVAVEWENIFGVQFHPEKSQDAGLDLLERFVKHTK